MISTIPMVLAAIHRFQPLSSTSDLKKFGYLKCKGSMPRYTWQLQRSPPQGKFELKFEYQESALQISRAKRLRHQEEHVQSLIGGEWGEEWEECGCTRSIEGLGWPWLSGQGSQCKRNSKGAAWKGSRTLKIEDFIWLQWEGAGVVISRELTWSNFCTYEALYYCNMGKISLGWEIGRECGEILYPIELYNKIKKKTIICYVGSKNGGPLGM